VTHFTHYTIGHAHLGLYAFYTMMMFGSMYYIVPRLTGWEWSSARLIRLHFWFTAVGILIYFGAFTWGGWYQGIMLNKLDSSGKPVPFMDVVEYTKPYLFIRSSPGGVIGVGHIDLVVLVVACIL